jgi:hypothetical protein
MASMLNMCQFNPNSNIVLHQLHTSDAYSWAVRCAVTVATDIGMFGKC